MTADELAAKLRNKCSRELSYDGNPVAKERHRRLSESDRVAAKMHSLMTSGKPPKSREQAIKSTVGTLAFILQFVFPQYALLIKLAGMAWDLMTGGQA